MKTARAGMVYAPGKLALEEYPLPSVGQHDGLMRVEAAALTGADYEYWSGRGSKPEDYPRAIRFPFIPGHIIVGRIDGIGRDAARDWEVEEGDRVLMQYSVTCGQCRMCRTGNDRRCARLLGYGLWYDFTHPPHLFGGAADYMYLHPNSKMVKVPEDVDPGRLCLQERFSDGCNWVLRQGEVTAYDRVLIMGTGALAQAAIMVAKVAGARPVMVLARSGSTRIPAARAAGADLIVTGSESEVVEQVRDETNGEMASVVLDLTTRDAYDVTRIAMRCAGYRARIVQIAAKTPGDMVGINAQQLIGEELTLKGANGHDYADLRMAASLLGRPELAAADQMNLARYRLNDLEEALNTPSADEGAVLTIIEP